mmetsp:Transcript_24874/g.25501  ORF Transcript_24874/g.25501 Transcript_24874/m.25501 type:complete len:306 (+) Transcript_24874:36-953(+)
METYKSLGIKPSIFGDPLGNRGDYSKGIYYSGRRKYLYDENSNLPPMEPPRDMMTNKQKRKSCLVTTQGVPLIQRLDFKRAPDGNEIRPTGKKIDAFRKKNILVITTTKTSKEDWKLQTQAGCKFWVHIQSGEVRTECPFSSSISSPTPSSSSSTCGGVGVGGANTSPTTFFPSPQSKESTPNQKSLFPSPILGTKSAEFSNINQNSPRINSNTLTQQNSNNTTLQTSDEIVLIDSEEDFQSSQENFRESPISNNQQYNQQQQQEFNDIDEGTGALVYNNQEYLDLLLALEGSFGKNDKNNKHFR